jgi:prepilin-type N-terminal cleavage/methylation domain-containing protein
MGIIKSEKGFTLLEMIAVLVILGIIAAVAVPKYISLLEEGRNRVAQAAIAEVKGRATSYYGVQTLRAGAAPAAAAVLASVTATPNLGTDYTVTAAITGTNNILITVTAVKGVALSPTIAGTWIYPTP